MSNLKFASELVINGISVKQIPCLVGEDIPEDTLGKNGSLYLHSQTGIIYCKNNGSYIRPNIVNGPSANSIMQVGCVIHPTEAPYAAAFGQSQATGSHAFSEGWATKSTGVSSHAEGNNNSATANDAHVGGAYSRADHPHSFVHGVRCLSSATNQTIFGRCSYKDTDALFIIGNGIYNAEAEDLGAIRLRNAFVVHADGTILLNKGGTMCKLILNDNGSITWEALPNYYS